MSSPRHTDRIAIAGATGSAAAEPTPEPLVRQALVRRVVDAIRAGHRVALPTETVYGMAADPTDAAAVERLRAEKGRGPDHQFTVHLANPEGLAALGLEVPPRARRLIDRYWPGPLTLVLPTPDGTTIGVRVPANEFTRAVLAAFDGGLLLTSINRTGEAPLQTPDEIAASGHVDLLVDAGPPRLGLASCVVQLDPPGPLARTA